jgi:hypothetical protein
MITRKATKVVVLFVVMFGPIVAIPQFYDPLGVRLWDDNYQMVSSYRCANHECTLIRLPEGKLTFRSGWTVTTNSTGQRVTPDNSPSCRLHIALIGDSYVWGPSVGDEETWANRLATRFPSACFYIYGQWGYNAEQAEWTLEQQVPRNMDYVVYFIFQNDDLLPYVLHDPGPPPNPFNLFRYTQLIAWKLGWLKQEGWGEEGDRYPDRFDAAIRKLAGDPRVRFVGFDEEILVHHVRDMGFDVFGIGTPSKAQRTSPIDDHPNADGHRMIAEQFYPFVEKILAAPI